MSVGADADNGKWAIYGARLGCYMTNLTDWDYIQVRDFEYINQMFFSTVLPEFSESADMSCFKSGVKWNSAMLDKKIEELGITLRKELGLHIAELNDTQSKFFKSAYVSLPRTGTYVTEADLEELRKVNK
jgi:hypothetical protein